MVHYIKAKELVKKINKEWIDYSYELNKHVVNTAYYALKHNIAEEEFDKYLDSVVKSTRKKLYSCGCQCHLDTPLGKRIREYEGGGDYVSAAISAFKRAVKAYYNDLWLYNESDGE